MGIAELDRSRMVAVSGFIAERMGLHFPEDRWADLARGLQIASLELGLGDLDTNAEWLTTKALSVRQIETLASCLTVGETYFFRDPASFETLARDILPRLVTSRAGSSRSLRLWSAGCCTGEEAYSLAITCTRAVPVLDDWNISILATDINPKALAKAEAGLYSDWSFRGTPPSFREQFFSKAADKKALIAPTLKKHIHFAYLNLAEDAYPSLHNHTNAMDVIFCRNVIMYFTPEHQARVVASLHRSLVDGGYLFVNPAEASHALFLMFAVENIGDLILFRKRPQGTHCPAEPAPGGPVARGWAPEPTADLTPPPALAIPPAVSAPRPPPVAAPIPKDPLVLARTCANQGRLEEALAFCEAAIAADRSNPAAQFLYAIICQELGRNDEAVAALGKVLYLDQDFILAHHALGDLYRQLGKKKESRRHLVLALELLSGRSRDEVVPESDGMTCGRLLESVRALLGA